MRTFWKRTIIVLVVVAAAVSFLIVRTMERAGQFTTLVEVKPGNCRIVTGFLGAEDLAIDRATGVVFVSEFDRRAARSGQPTRGRISMSTVDRFGAAIVDLTGPESGAPADFAPHGISLYVAPDGQRTLMVINHPTLARGVTEGGGDTIEIFDVSIGPPVLGVVGVSLRHRKTVSAPEIHDPNDIAAVDAERFYATNDHGSTTGFGRTLEDYLQLPRASLAYWDGAAGHIVVEGLTYANGVALSPDATRVYVAETTGRTLSIYARNAETGALSKTDAVFLGTGLDNIDVDDKGTIWIGAHPHLLDFVSHAGDASKHSASQILRLDPTADGKGGTARTVYLDLGRDISGSSVAVAGANHLIIGSVFEPKIVDCTLPAS